MANASSEEPQASSGRLGKQIQNHSLRTGVTDNGFFGGTGSANGNTCCAAAGVGAVSRAVTGDFHARGMATEDCLKRSGVRHDF